MAKSENEPVLPVGPDRDAAPRFDELHDWESDLFDGGVWSSQGEARERDGLPAHYKMKHDAHYVDELFSAKHARQVIQVRVEDIAMPSDEPRDPARLTDSLSEFGVLQPLLVRRNRGQYEVIAGSKRLAAAKAAGILEVPCLLYDADDQQARRIKEATNLRGEGAFQSANERTLMRTVFPLLGQSLQTIQASLRSLQSPQWTSDLIHTEARKAARLAWSAAILTSTPRLNPADFDAAEVLEEVLGACRKEGSFTDVRFDKRIQSRGRLKADRQLVFLALTGAVDAILPMACARQPSTLAISLARHEPTGSVVLQLSQNALGPAEGEWHRWFDLGWSERPGGIVAGLGLLAARRVIDIHNGRLAILPRQGGGCRLALSFPEIPRRD